jgi:uncharacterized protein YbaR (Trm112 family)
MPVAPDLLDILVCPECHQKVVPVHDGAGLRCPACHRVYPVDDHGIPTMIPEEAVIED